MIIKNCSLRKKRGLFDIVIKNGVFNEILPSDEKNCFDDNEIIDSKGNLVIPPFVEPHIHLDAVLTAGKPSFNISGTLFEGIKVWSDYKTQIPYTVDTVKENALKAIKMMLPYGIQHIRTHADVTDPELIGMRALLELKEEVKDFCELQVVAFPQDGIYSYPNGENLLIKSLEMGADAVGAIPHYEFCQEYGVKSIHTIMDLAQKYNKLVDVHCDEIDDDASRFLEYLATEAYERDYGDKVSASHTVAMHSYNNAYCSKLFKILKLSKINFICCPVANTHLQGRADNYPKRRGVTRVKELLDAGLNVAFGQDSIYDPWYPLGNGNIMRVVDMGLHVTHMTGYDDISNCLDLITDNGAKALNITDHYGIQKGNPANFLILDGTNDYDILRFQKNILYSVKNGKIIAKNIPAQSVLFV